MLYNDNNTVNTSITGLLPNTRYTCCVLAVTSYGESEPVCQNVTTADDVSDIIKYCVPLCQCSSLSDTDSDCTSNTSSLTITIQ